MKQSLLINNDFGIKYIFALINSKVVKYIWMKMFFDGKALFPKIKKN